MTACHMAENDPRSAYQDSPTMMEGWEHYFYAISGCAYADAVLDDLKAQPTSGINGIGQIMALFVAAGTILRMAWLWWKAAKGNPKLLLRELWVYPFTFCSSRSECRPFLVAYWPETVQHATLTV